MRMRALVGGLALCISGAVLAQADETSNDFWDRDWSGVSSNERQALLAAIDLGGLGVDDTLVQIERQGMSWYDGMVLYRIVGGWEPRNLFLYYVKQPNGVVLQLDGQSAPIHTINAAFPPDLNDDTIEHYVWFFNFFVRGSEGPFLVAESPQDTFVPKSGFDGAVLAEGFETVEETLRPLNCLSLGEEIGFLCSAAVYYSNAVFEVAYQIDTDGTVAMMGDQPLASDLPVRINAPIAISEVSNFLAVGSPTVDSPWYIPVLDDLESGTLYDWTADNNLFVGGLAAALVGTCRSELPAGHLRAMSDISHFALATSFGYDGDADVVPTPNRESAPTSILGLGQIAIAELDCATQAEDMAFNIMFNRLTAYSQSPFMAGCTSQYATAACTCLLDASAIALPEMVTLPYDYGLIESLFEINSGTGFAILYSCGVSPPDWVFDLLGPG